MLEEYPSYNNGLSRTAKQALKIIAEDEGLAGKVFGLSQESEGRSIGDTHENHPRK